MNLSFRTITVCLALLFAAAALLIAQERAPGISTAYDKAFRLLQEGRGNDALIELDRALATEPDNPSLNNLRGLAAAQLGRSSEAEASFRKVIRLRPHAAMGYNNLAALFWQLGNSAEAASTFRQAIK